MEWTPVSQPVADYLQQEKLAAWYPQASISCEMELPAVGMPIPHIEKEQKQLN